MSTVTAFDFDPPTFEMASTETVPLAFNFSNYLAAGEHVTSATCLLTNMRTEAAYAAGLSGSPTVAADVVTQTITALAGGERYELLVTATIAANKIMTGRLVLTCPTRSAA